MAIKKQIEIGNSGLTCDYWKIQRIELDFSQDSSKANEGKISELKIWISGYKDTESRTALKEPFFNKEFNFKMDKFPIEKQNLQGNNILKLAYEELKKHKDFEESEDDMNERSKK